MNVNMLQRFEPNASLPKLAEERRTAPIETPVLQPGPADVFRAGSFTLLKSNLRGSFASIWRQVLDPSTRLGSQLDDILKCKILNSYYVTKRTSVLLEFCCFLVPIANELIKQHFIKDRCSLFVGLRKRNVRGDSLHNFFQRLILATYFPGGAYSRTEVQSAWGNWLGVDLRHPKGDREIVGEVPFYIERRSAKSVKNERTLERCVSDVYKIVAAFGEDVARQLAQYVYEKSGKLSERTLREAGNEFSLICGPHFTCPGRQPKQAPKRSHDEVSTASGDGPDDVPREHEHEEYENCQPPLKDARLSLN